MQSSFFFDSGTLFPVVMKDVKSPDNTGWNPGDSYMSVLSEAVLSKNRKAGSDLLLHLFENFYQRQDIFPHEVKDLYYKFFMVLDDCRQQLKLAPAMGPENLTGMAFSRGTVLILHFSALNSI